jgi:hypothetical protein
MLPLTIICPMLVVLPGKSEVVMLPPVTVIFARASVSQGHSMKSPADRGPKSRDRANARQAEQPELAIDGVQDDSAPFSSAPAIALLHLNRN